MKEEQNKKQKKMSKVTVISLARHKSEVSELQKRLDEAQSQLRKFQAEIRTMNERSSNELTDINNIKIEREVLVNRCQALGVALETERKNNSSLTFELKKEKGKNLSLANELEKVNTSYLSLTNELEEVKKNNDFHKTALENETKERKRLFKVVNRLMRRNLFQRIANSLVEGMDPNSQS